MKTISRRICGVLLGLCVLGLIVPVVRADEMADWMAEKRRQNDEYHRSGSSGERNRIGPTSRRRRSREARDRAYQEAQAEQAARDRAYQEAQEEQAARDRAYQEAQAEQAARDRAYQEQQQQREAQAGRRRSKRPGTNGTRTCEWYQAERDAWYKWNQEVQQWREKERKQKEWDDWLDRITGRTDWSAAAPNPTPANLRNTTAPNHWADQVQTAAGRRFRGHAVRCSLG